MQIDQTLNDHILIVEDEPIFRKYIKKTLVNHGYRVSESDDVDGALALMSKASFDLVISDVYMPGKTGQDLLSEIKIKFPNIPVIIISGLPEIETAVECMKIGAFDFVSKPIEIEKFYKSIEKALDESKNIADKLGTITISPSSAQTLAGYSIIKTLGEGSMGIVFLAEKTKKPEDRSQYALKIVKSSLSEKRNKKLLTRFFNEIDIISKFDHPNIVKIYEHGFSKEMRIPYFVMEYLEGNSLRDYLAGQLNLELRDKVKVIYQIASALACIHRNGICHRDIKPANILILNNGQAKLMDFGIARIPDSEITQTHQFMGTPAYFSPECLNNNDVDFRSDLFSLGTVAYEMFLGTKPFKGDSLFVLAQEILELNPLEPRKIEPNFPPSLQLILGKMLSKNPKSRYQTAEDLVLDFDTFLDTSLREDQRVKAILSSRQTGLWS